MVLCRCSRRADGEFIQDEQHTLELFAPLTIQSFPKTPNAWGYTGTRYQGPNRAFSLQGASTYEEHIEKSATLPFPMDTGFHILPEDVQEAISFIAHRGSAGIRAFWLKQLAQVQQRAQDLMPILQRLRATVEPSKEASRARIHVPLLKELLEEAGMGGSNWCDQFVTGFPILGELGEPGVYPPSSQPPSYISREKLFEGAKERFVSKNRAPDPNAERLWIEAMDQVGKQWLDGPHPFNDEGELMVNGEPVQANPAFRFGVQQGEKLRAVDDLKRSATNEATFVATPINLPSWDHIAQMCSLYYLKGDRRPLAIAKADHADAYKQLPVATKDELAAVVTLKDLVDGRWYGFIPRTQLFGSTAAVLHYNCLSRVIASLACRILKIPCVGYYDDFGIILPECLVKDGLSVFTSFNKALRIILKDSKSEFGTLLEFLGLTISFWNDGSPTLASLSLSQEKIRKLVQMIEALSTQHSVALAHLQKLAGKLCFTQTAIMGRFGRAALRPIYELISQGGGTLTVSFKRCLQWWVRVLPAIMPRLIMSFREPEDEEPFRIYSDATGEGNLASICFPPQANQALPFLLKGSSSGELDDLAASTNAIFIFELFAMVASVFQLRDHLTGKRVILFVDNEAACAALTTGTSKVPGALLLVYALYAMAAEHDIALWTERVPTGVNPADLPSRHRELSFTTQPSVVLASLEDLLSAYDFSWVLLQSK